MLHVSSIPAFARLRQHVVRAALATVLWPAAAIAEPTVAARWNQSLLDAVKATRSSDVVTARSLAVVHTAMFDAWASYDDKALSTTTGAAWRRPAGERTAANKEKAVSYAAYRTLIDLFPSEKEKLTQALRGMGHDPNDAALDPATPVGIGNLAARNVLYGRHQDGSNQLGDLRERAYSDWTGWKPVNPPDKLVEPRRFQPPSSVDAQGKLQVRNFGAAHFALVRTFALETPWEFRPTVAPIQTGTDAEAKRVAEENIRISADLNDMQKATADVWALDSGSEQPPGYWAKLAQFVADKRGHKLDDDVKLFFALGNAMLDAAVATMDAKVAWNGARPEPFIKHYFRGETIQAWGGKGRGKQTIKGEDFQPYLPTSASPEHVSGHSSFGATGATLLRLSTGSDALGYEVTFPANGLKNDAGPPQEIRFRWNTFTEAADAAGLSRVYGGIHFWTGDRHGREMGDKVAQKAWRKAQVYFGQ
jgi:PAP2 superfamily